MSNGTLQQLASKGVQDGHLSISPETSFFKRTYKRVSNYAIEAIDQTISSMAWGKDYQVQVSRNGDLLCETWLVVSINLLRLAVPAGDSVYWTNSLGHAMLKTGTFEVGNNSIDTITGLYLEIKWELESDVNVDTNELVLRGNNVNELINWSFNGNTYDVNSNPVTKLYVKVPFYYSKARSQSVPLIALQYHDVRVRFSLRAKSELVIYTNAANTTLDATNNGDIQDGALMCNFAYTDAMERRLFAANPHEYLIKNIQVSDFHTKASGATKVQAQVIFNHPVVALYWVVQRQATLAALDYFNFERTDGQGDDTITTATMLFNGSRRETPRDPLFWRTVQPSLYFGRTPRRNIYCYSFCQYPSAWWPSGSVNLSRIDSTQLEFTMPAVDATGAAFGIADITIIAENYNVFRIQGGMGAKKSTARIAFAFVRKSGVCCKQASKSTVPGVFLLYPGANHLHSEQAAAAAAA